MTKRNRVRPGARQRDTRLIPAIWANTFAPVAHASVSSAGSGTLEYSSGIASFTRVATGRYDVVFSEPMENTNYVALFTSVDSGVSRTPSVVNKTVNGFRVSVTIISNGNYVDQKFDMVVFNMN